MILSLSLLTFWSNRLLLHPEKVIMVFHFLRFLFVTVAMYIVNWVTNFSFSHEIWHHWGHGPHSCKLCEEQPLWWIVFCFSSFGSNLTYLIFFFIEKTINQTSIKLYWNHALEHLFYRERQLFSKSLFSIS